MTGNTSDDGKLPIVLVIDRDMDQFVQHYSTKHLEPKGYGLWWVDSCGSRSVHYYAPSANSNAREHYDTAEDLPEDVYNSLLKFFTNHLKVNLDTLTVLKRMEDPGLGIMLPEDYEVLKQGGLPDGCIATATK